MFARGTLRRLWGWAKSPAVWAPALFLAAATVFFWMTNADLAISRRFFARPDGRLDERWPLMITQPWCSLYRWGIYPAWILGGGGLVVWIASFAWRKLEPWRDPGLFLALVLIIGPGILVNSVLKPFWNRPRPNATILFGGEREFLPVGVLGQHENNASFPSGHAATGFYLMTPAFLCYRRHLWWAVGFVVLGIAAGSIIGMARIVAGGHFASDVLWAGGVVYFTALALAAPFRFGQDRPKTNEPSLAANQ